MSPAARVSAAVLFLLLVFVGGLVGPDQRSLGATTYGTPGWGMGALYDLFVELDLPVERSFASPARLPSDATVWWIRPGDLCSKLGASAREAIEGDTAEEPWAREWQLDEFVRGGGTAVVWLAARERRCLLDAELAGHPLPSRLREVELELAYEEWRDCDECDDPFDGADPRIDPAEPFAAGVGGASEEDYVEHRLGGALSSRSRLLIDVPLAIFADPRGWQVVTTLDDKPFVVERHIGAGVAVLVADASFLRNEVFDRGDAAPFAVEMVRAYGVPRFDEREHGLSDAPPTVRYLAGSSAAPVFAGVAVVLALFAWSARALPRRSLVDPAPELPTLETFVDSIAALYARTGDRARVLERYRELTLGRLRRALGLSSDVSRELLLERLRRHPAVDADALALLIDEDSDPSQARVRETAGRLDRLVHEVAR